MNNKASIANILNDDTSNTSYRSEHRSFVPNNHRSNQTLPAINDVFSVVPISYPGGPQIQLVPDGDLANFNRSNSMILNHEVLDAMSMKTAAAAEAYNIAADSWRRASQTLFEYENSFENNQNKPKRKYRRKLSRGNDSSDPDSWRNQPHERLKRPRNGYMIFMNEVYEETKAKNPRMKFGEISAAIGARWKNMSKREKMPYHQKHEDEKAMYESAKLAMSKSNLYIVEEKIPIQIEQKASPKVPPPQLLTPKSPAATLKTPKPSPPIMGKTPLVKNTPEGFSGDIISSSPSNNGSNVPLLSTPLTPRDQRSLQSSPSSTVPMLPSMIRKFPINRPESQRNPDFPYRSGYINHPQNVRQSVGTVSPTPNTTNMNTPSSKGPRNIIRIVRPDIISKNQSNNKGKNLDIIDFNNNKKKKKVVVPSQREIPNQSQQENKRLKLNNNETKSLSSSSSSSSPSIPTQPSKSSSSSSTPTQPSNSSKSFEIDSSSQDIKKQDSNLKRNLNADGEVDDTSTSYDETFYSAEEDYENSEKLSTSSSSLSVDVNSKSDETLNDKNVGGILETKDSLSDVLPSTLEKSLTSPNTRSSFLKKPIESIPNTRWYFPYVGTKTSPPGLCPFRKRKVRTDDADDDENVEKKNNNNTDESSIKNIQTELNTSKRGRLA